jgi:mannose-6-phosphate isomerase
MRPVFFEKVWGGDKLRRLADKGAPEGGPLGEAWEVADLPQGASVVASGPLAGRTLRELVEEHGAELIGDTAVDGRFPLLVKLIDAADDLSVQVHPGADDVRRFEGAASKEEAWVIVDVDDGGRVLHGFVDGVTPERFRASITDGTAGAQLRTVDVRAGDVVHVTPGTFHAIGRGVFLLEVQQPSDTTFRVWDWGRMGLDGKPRALHVEQALEVARYGPQPDALAAPVALPTMNAANRELLVDAGSFRMERLSLQPMPLSWSTPSSSPLVLMPTTQSLVVRTDAGEAEVAPLTTCIVAAAHERITIEPAGHGDVIVAGVGGADLLGA